jgi:hypothetical protein
MYRRADLVAPWDRPGHVSFAIYRRHLLRVAPAVITPPS